MNNIKKIIERIDADAQAQIEKINADADLACQEIREQYEKTAEEQCGKIIEDGEKDAALRAERIESAAQLDAKKYTLGVKQNVIAKLFDKAVDRLVTLPENYYVELLAQLARRASDRGDEEVILSPKDREAFGKAVIKRANELLLADGKSANLKLSDTTRDIKGGLVISRGKVEVNCAADVLVGSYKNELTAEIAKILFD